MIFSDSYTVKQNCTNIKSLQYENQDDSESWYLYVSIEV